jgi:hypothetical protein
MRAIAIGLATLSATVLLAQSTVPRAWDDEGLRGRVRAVRVQASGPDIRPVKGHEFGLKLSASERGALIAFLRSL